MLASSCCATEVVPQHEALRLFAASLQISQAENLLYPMLHALSMQGIALIDAGRYDNALTTLEEALSLSEKVGHDLISYRFPQPGLAFGGHLVSRSRYRRVCVQPMTSTRWPMFYYTHSRRTWPSQLIA